MRDLQTSGIVGLSASKVGYRYSDRHGEVNDKKNVAVLPTVPASIRATKGSASLVMPAINFSCLCPD